MSTDTPWTKIEAYRRVKDAGEDVSLRRKVAASIAVDPATTSELADRFDEHSSNALRPRVDELLRMGCVERDGTRKNPSGHEAYVHHLTRTGDRYLRGEVDPEPGPTLSELKTDVVDTARAVVNDDASMAALATVVQNHDATKLTRDPEWVPPYDMREAGGSDDTDGEQDTDADADADAVLTDEERTRIENDPVLTVDDVLAERGGT